MKYFFLFLLLIITTKAKCQTISLYGNYPAFYNTLVIGLVNPQVQFNFFHIRSIRCGLNFEYLLIRNKEKEYPGVYAPSINMEHHWLTIGASGWVNLNGYGGVYWGDHTKGFLFGGGLIYHHVIARNTQFLVNVKHNFLIGYANYISAGIGIRKDLEKIR